MSKTIQLMKYARSDTVLDHRFSAKCVQEKVLKKIFQEYFFQENGLQPFRWRNIKCSYHRDAVKKKCRKITIKYFCCSFLFISFIKLFMFSVCIFVYLIQYFCLCVHNILHEFFFKESGNLTTMNEGAKKNILIEENVLFFK